MEKDEEARLQRKIDQLAVANDNLLALVAAQERLIKEYQELVAILKQARQA
jgi:hypothetical protein